MTVCIAKVPACGLCEEAKVCTCISRFSTENSFLLSESRFSDWLMKYLNNAPHAFLCCGVNIPQIYTLLINTRVYSLLSHTHTHTRTLVLFLDPDTSTSSEVAAEPTSGGQVGQVAMSVTLICPLNDVLFECCVALPTAHITNTFCVLCVVCCTTYSLHAPNYN